MALQQALADLNAAYQNFFASPKGSARGRSGAAAADGLRKDRGRRCGSRRTLGSRSCPTGGCACRRSGTWRSAGRGGLPSAPSSVTVDQGRGGPVLRSFVVETDPAADAERFPSADSEVGIDLGPDRVRGPVGRDRGRRSPKFLRRAEREAQAAQRIAQPEGEGRQEPGEVAGPAGPRARSGRRHAPTSATRCSTQIIRDNQAVYVEDLCVAGLARTRLAK